jgi:RNA polymerase subunit RPABC4/transcription elongation factor Spt4
MNTVYACLNCKAIGRSYVSSCPKCSSGHILGIPFDGSFVMVDDSELRSKLKEAYDRTCGNTSELGR